MYWVTTIYFSLYVLIDFFMRNTSKPPTITITEVRIKNQAVVYSPSVSLIEAYILLLYSAFIYDSLNCLSLYSISSIYDYLLNFTLLSRGLTSLSLIKAPKSLASSPVVYSNSITSFPSLLLIKQNSKFPVSFVKNV